MKRIVVHNFSLGLQKPEFCGKPLQKRVKYYWIVLFNKPGKRIDSNLRFSLFTMSCYEYMRAKQININLRPKRWLICKVNYYWSNKRGAWARLGLTFWSRGKIYFDINLRPKMVDLSEIRLFKGRRPWLLYCCLTCPRLRSP